MTNFFARRNVTSTPATYELPKIFKEIVQDLASLRGDAVVDHVRQALTSRSASDDAFREALSRPVYEENAAMCRFVLTSLVEEGMTDETRVDLWEMAGSPNKRYYRWTIEHIFPQGPNIPPSWEHMMGGREAANEAHETQVHRLGNLTLTGYNASLGNKSFEEKRDRVDQAGRFVGYRNGLNLNHELTTRES